MRMLGEFLLAFTIGFIIGMYIPNTLYLLPL